jgi:hypothetical protein
MQTVFTCIPNFIIFVEVILALLKGAELINPLPKFTPSKVLQSKTIMRSCIDVCDSLNFARLSNVSKNLLYCIKKTCPISY